MGWQERGKRRVHCGRTVRRNCQIKPKRKAGVILKYQENAVEFSSSAKSNLLQDRYDLTDGLHMTDIPHRRNTIVEYSLNKRKRWLLRDLVKERQIVDEDQFNEGSDDVEEEDFEDIHVSFHERHIMPGSKRYLGDCVSYYNDHIGERSPKGHYSYYTDLNRQCNTTKPPEIGYEICNPPATGTWPDFCETQFRYERFWDINGKKARCKCKGRNKRDRFGLKNDKELHTSHRYRKVQKLDANSKVKVVSKKEFYSAYKNVNTINRNAGLTFNIDDVLVRSTKQHDKNLINNDKSIPNSSDVTRFSKGSAIFVEKDPIKAQSGVAPQESQQSFTATKQHKVTVNIDVEDLKASRLVSQWGDSYREGAVLPRMFAINVNSLLPKKMATNCDTNVVFEIPGQSLTGGDITVALLHASIGENSNLEDTAKDFVKHIERISRLDIKPLEVKDVVEAGVQCVKVADALQDEVGQPRAIKTTGHVNSVTNLNLLNSTYGWRSEAFTLEEAQQEIIKEKLGMEGRSSKGTHPAGSDWTMVSMECQICYTTIEDNLVTTLTECGHSFCNECWVSHVVTQVTQGTDDIKCPGYDCDSKVDNLIMMTLTPKLYERYLNRQISKHLETSPDWKWCPGKHCQNLVKAVQHDTSNNSKSMTVLCSCNTTWCYKCQEKAHWPATCEESKAFFERSGYAEYLLKKESQDLISAVMVKNCPRCNYPIEKYHGCQFMHCVLCSSHFCWNCLTEANYGHSCEKKPDDDLTMVVLNHRSKRFNIQKYLQVIVHNSQASSPRLMYAKKRRLDEMESIQTSRIVSTVSGSRMTQFMHSFSDNLQALNNVKSAVEFEYQARIILDGLVQKAAVTKTMKKRTVAVMKMSKLIFIVGRIDSIIREPALMSKHDRLVWLDKLVEMGTECIVSLKNFS